MQDERSGCCDSILHAILEGWSHVVTSFVRKYPRYRSIAVNWHRAALALSLPFTVSSAVLLFSVIAEITEHTNTLAIEQPILTAC